ncbi:leucine-rich repeat protein [Skeletonema marinoi]|uniref:Leucine-rich repeat protein n=1 Tax=Skeletonema marinoi TaxID=267567 RepID=A0AAD9DAM1_9STRA|nr:leucine-rich repeat protein [Skeletonema marinoi]
MKKRKANDGRVTADGTHDVDTSNNNDGDGFLSSWFGYFSGQRGGALSGSPNNDHFAQQSLSKMDRMEQIMMRVEEKLATVSSLESRCEQLEAQCSSLENLLVSTSQSTKEHIDRKYDSLYLHLEQKCDSLANILDTKVDSVHKKVERSLKFHEYNDMLVKNQDWEYSAAVNTADELIDYGYAYEEAGYIACSADQLRDITTKMRRGEFPRERNGNEKGVSMEMPDDDPIFSEAASDELLPHWKEFAVALKQFTPAINVLPDNCESFFTFSFVQMSHNAMLLIKEALIGKPFQKLTFVNNDNGDGAPGGMSVDAIISIVESNKRLRKLEIGRNRIGRVHIERLCSAVQNHALVQLDLSYCLAPGIGDEILTCLLTIGDLKLEKLVMSSNNITTAVGTLLADFLASNPRLKELVLEEDYLNDSDVALIANALRSNTTLKYLRIDSNNITKVGEESLRLVLYDESSLNAVADSNHTCTANLHRHWDLDLLGRNDIDYNPHDKWHINRGWKIYSILSSRNETMSNVQHFSDIDVKILPIMLEAVQTYATNVDDSKVKPLSIVYEVMRKWDKALTCTGAGNIIET